MWITTPKSKNKNRNLRAEHLFCAVGSFPFRTGISLTLLRFPKSCAIIVADSIKPNCTGTYKISRPLSGLFLQKHLAAYLRELTSCEIKPDSYIRWLYRRAAHLHMGVFIVCLDSRSPGFFYAQGRIRKLAADAADAPRE